MKYSLMFFSSGEGASAQESLRQILHLAVMADEHGLERVWLPERHFVRFGALHPNPAVLAGAIAARTSRLRIAAGSVVAPLHDPLRIAEEWALVDNLSGGRVDMALASGWRAEDFCLAPELYASRHAVLEERIGQVRRLWSGHAIARQDGEGRWQQVATLPHPVQPGLPLWVTAARNPHTFELAGRCGANVLTYLIDVGLDGLAERLALYRSARAAAGHSGPGVVTVMLHTYLGEDSALVKSRVAPQYLNYLIRNAELLGRPGDAAASIDAADARALAGAQFERAFERLSLMGGIAQCRPLAARLAALGVDEIACLIDFVDDWQMIGDALPSLLTLAQESGAVAAPGGAAIPASQTAATPLAQIGQEQFYAHIAALGGHYGPQFQWVQSVTVNDTEARARLAAPACADPAAWRAQLLDAAVSTAHAIGMQPGMYASSRALALPVGFGSVQFASPAGLRGAAGPGDYNVYTRRRSGFQRADGALVFDVAVTGGDGRPVLTINSMRMQRLPAFGAAAGARPALLHQVCWREWPAPAPASEGAPPCFVHAQDAPPGLLAALRDEGARCVPAQAGPDGAPAGPDLAPVALWCVLPADPGDDADALAAADLATGQAHRMLADFLQWSAAQALAGGPPMLVLVNGANEHVDGAAQEAPPSPASAAVWAAAGSLLMAWPKAAMLVLDLDPDVPWPQQAALIVQLQRGTARGCFALRGGRAFHIDIDATLASAPALDRCGPPLAPGARVLVTGGTGGLGRVLASWLLAEGAGHLRIVARHTDRAAPWVRLLREADSGLRLDLVDADVATAAGARAALAGLPEGERWDAVFHLAGDAAGMWGDQGAPGTIERCLAPKLDALSELCRAWGARAPRQLVLFGSMSAIQGSAGQPCYAAANAAFAALARMHPGMRGVDLRVCWFGPWEGEGMAGHPLLRSVLESKGLVPMAPGDALACLRDVLSSSCRTALIARSATGAPALATQAVHAGAPQRQGVLRADLLRMLGAIMQVAPDALRTDHNLYDLGFDSLMAIEFKHMVQQELGVELTLSALLDTSTIDQLIEVMLPMTGAAPDLRPAAGAGQFEMVI